ncbi:hypothetical protein Tco_1073169 [Tanacetum coccineum]
MDEPLLTVVTMDEPLLTVVEDDGGIESTTYDAAIHLSKLNSIKGTVIVRVGDNGDDLGGVVADFLVVYKYSFDYCKNAKAVIQNFEALLRSKAEESLLLIIDFVFPFSCGALINKTDQLRCRNLRLMAMEVCLAMGSITDCTTLQVMTGLVEEYVSYQSDWLKFTINFPDDYKETSKYILGLLEEVSRVD